MLEYNVPQEVVEEFHKVMEPYSTPIGENPDVTPATEITNAVSTIWDLLAENGAVEVQKVNFADDMVAIEQMENPTRDGIGAALANEGNTAFLISNDKGATLCLTYTKVGDKGYFQWLSPENARVIQEGQMEALQKVGLEAAKELTLGQRILNAFSMAFRHRPIEAVARREAYLNFYENARRAAEKASLLTDYGEHRKVTLTNLHEQRVQEEQQRQLREEEERLRQQELEKQRQQELEKQRQQELEKQRQLEIEQRQRDIAKLEKDIPELSKKIASMEQKYNENEKTVNAKNAEVKKIEDEYNKLKKGSTDYAQNNKKVETLLKNIKGEYYRLKDLNEDFAVLQNRRGVLANWQSFHKDNEVKLERANRDLALMQKAFDVLGLEKKDVYISGEEYLTKMLDSSKEERENALREINAPLEKDVARLQKLIDERTKKLETLNREKEELGIFALSAKRQKNEEISKLETELENLELEQDIPKKKIEENNELFKESMNQMLNEMADMSPKEKQEYAYELVLAMRHQYEDALKNLNNAKEEQEKAQKQYNNSLETIAHYEKEIESYVQKGTRELTPEEKVKLQNLTKTWDENKKWQADNKKMHDTLKKHGANIYSNATNARNYFNKKILEPHKQMGNEIKTAKNQLGEMQNNLTQLKGMNAPEAKQNQPEVKPAAKGLGGIS